VSGKVTRGNGLLERVLAKKRTTIANSLLPAGLRSGRILDVGCGTSPFFLQNTDFHEKYGVDRIPEASVETAADPGVMVKNFDLASGHRLPFDDNFFDAVTMLAVLEHLETETIALITREVYRVLRQGGVYVGTTPVWWADSILRNMARLRLVSSEEIEEHKTFFTRDKLHSVIEGGGFLKENITTGSFEVGMNLWFVAQKY
jgi:ubiquinone/menaquinone biosynthesis C-methylase UbiE